MRLHLALTASLSCGIAMIAGPSAPLRAGQQAPPALFTAEQAAAGRTSYQANCASCHVPDLSGRNEAPPLAGANFMNVWRTRTSRDLFEYIQSAMPPSGENLGADQYLAITAFLLQANGAQPGSQAFTATTSAPIGSVATGAPRAAAAASAGQTAGRGRGGRGDDDPESPNAGRGGRGAAPGAGVIGLTTSGEVKNYVPVADEMLRSQDPGDWLMARRNYLGWSSSRSPRSRETT